ncbi:MFS transporter [Candidatus Woesebacteria bacterium]|nr:MFS transporter [Candidatus Woesebacteria bacterium]
MHLRGVTHFPTFNNRNVKLYYLLTIFMNGWFILPNWVFYFGQYITIPKIGLIDGLSKLVAVFLEIPSGSLADLIGKKHILILGNIFQALCCVVLMSATNFTWLLIGNIITFIGFALISGAKEALLYDSLLDIHKEEHYDEVVGKVGSIAMFVTVLSIFIGGYLYGINPKLTFVAWLVFSLIAILILLFMKEPEADEKLVTYKEYMSKLKTGVHSIFSKPLIGFVLPVLFFSMLIKSYEGVIRQNTGAYFGFNGETFGYIFALILIPTLLVSYNYSKIRNLFKSRVEYVFILLYLVGFLIVYLTNNLAFGMVSFLSIYIAQEIAKPYILGLVNRNTESKHRATALSTVSLFSEFPYMIIVIFMGTLLDIPNIKYLYLGFVIILIAYAVRRYIYKDHERGVR